MVEALTPLLTGADSSDLESAASRPNTVAQNSSPTHFSSLFRHRIPPTPTTMLSSFSAMTPPPLVLTRTAVSRVQQRRRTKVRYLKHHRTLPPRTHSHQRVNSHQRVTPQQHWMRKLARRPQRRSRASLVGNRTGRRCHSAPPQSVRERAAS